MFKYFISTLFVFSTLIIHAKAAEEIKFSWEVLGRMRNFVHTYEPHNKSDAEIFQKSFETVEVHYRTNINQRIKNYSECLNRDMNTQNDSCGYFGYTQYDTLRTIWNPKLSSYVNEGGKIHPQITSPSRFVRFKIDNLAQLNANDRSRCVWKVNGFEVKYTRKCDAILTLMKDSRNEVSVELKTKSGKLLRKSEIANIKHKTIVVLGDSFSSGEGNPHTTYRNIENGIKVVPFWWEHRCHRSLASYSMQAALKYTEDKHTSIQVLNFACSGAKIESGILDKYAGVVSKENIQLAFFDHASTPEPHYNRNLKTYPSQIEQAYRIINNGSRERKPKKGSLIVDHIIMTIGVNDIGFSNIVKTLTLNDLEEILKNKSAFIDKLKDDIQNLNYNSVKAQVEGMNPTNRNFISLYPNPLRVKTSRRLEYCDDFNHTSKITSIPKLLVAFGYGLSKDEEKFAELHIINPLNRKIKNTFSSDTDKWVVLKEMSERSEKEGRGFCAGTKSWFNTVDQSMFRQNNIYGSMHPNLLGHHALAKELAEELSK